MKLLAKAVDALRDSGQSGVAQELLETEIGRHTPGFEMTVCRICEQPTNDDLWHCCWRK